MVASDKYSKLDPKDAKILDLTTKFTSPEHCVSANLENVKSGDGSGGGYRGNQGKKTQVCLNGSLTIKVSPSNTRGRQSGGARFIKTRTYYSISSKFGTN